MATASAAKLERIEARVTAEDKTLVQQAAALAGMSLTDFIMLSAREAAMETIRSHQVIRLTVEDSAAFAEALLNPPEPNENLRALAEHYRKFMGE
jgi:uncharacterized protein (DUF1778 family)